VCVCVCVLTVLDLAYLGGYRLEYHYISVVRYAIDQKDSQRMRAILKLGPQ
jgi:hypothetical protein